MTNLKKLTALVLALCLVLTSVIALAEVEQLESKLIQPTGTVTGDLEAQGKFYADYSSLEESLEAGNRLHLQMVEEGQVLLKNENNALPLSADERDITFLGLATIDYVRTGGGSGHGSGTDYAVDWVQAFEQEGFNVNPKTIDLYETLFAVNGGAHEANDSGKLLEPDMSVYSTSVKSTFKSYDDVAVVTISRFGRENVDLKTNQVDGHSDPNDHYLQLEDNELELIKMAKEHFNKVVVMINSSMIMEIPELNAPVDTEYGVDAILWVGGLGDQGTVAAAEILTGKVNPSGHTPDIWYTDFKADPTWTNWSDMTQNFDENGERMNSWLTYEDGTVSVFSAVEFREGIYYGYRYYETKADDMNAVEPGSGEEWYQKAVLYPFGYGLSYTTFDWKLAGVSEKNITAPNQTVSIAVEVTNTGDVAGKDVVQIYATTPYYKGGIEKASAVLVGFAKTDLLQPGESQTVQVDFVAQDMASFDWNDANKNGNEGYELDAGAYIISARRNSHDVVLSETFNIAETILCKTDLVTGAEINPVFVDDFDTTREDLLENMISRATGLEQPKAQTAEERVMEDWEAAMLDAQEIYKPYMDEEGQPWYVSEVPENWTQNAPTDVTLADLAGLVYTEPTVVDGVATAATDEASQLWDEYMNSLSWEQMVKLFTDGDGGQDGPVQYRGTCWQSTPIAAATWDQELIREQGRMYGNQALLSGSFAWRGPGTNIHRNPFNGRTFEYYSEDPMLTSIMAAIIVDEVTSKGIGCFAKHMFANVQEHNRADYGGVCTFATEQVFREIYMRSFEWMVKYGHTTGMMTSFNRIGYVVNSNNWAVHEQVLRDEWGFTGATVNDMWARDFVSNDLMLRAGDDTLMGGNASFTKTYITIGEWDQTARDGKGMIKVPTEEGDNMFLSPTHYYALRKSAQRIQQTKANSNQYKNYATNYELTATVTYGVANKANIVCANTSDFSLTVPEGSGLPVGMSIDGAVLNYNAEVLGVKQQGDEGWSSSGDNSIYGEFPAQGTYIVTVDMACDGYINVSGAKLTINVVSPFQVNDEIIAGTADTLPTIKLAKGEAADIMIDSDMYAYQNFVGSSQITNWYTKNGAKYLRDEEKTHADGTTIPYSEVEEKHELSYTIEGNLPAGMTAEVVTGTAYGLRTYKGFEIVTGIRLVGTPTEAGEYVISVTEVAPTCMAMAGIWLSPSGEVVVSQEFTIVVE